MFWEREPIIYIHLLHLRRNMKKEILEKIVNFKEKFSRFFVHRKKLKALENYGEVAKFKNVHHEGFKLLKNFAESGFLEQKDEEYLDHLLDRYSIKFLDWSHKTAWLKEKMERMKLHQNQRNPSRPVKSFVKRPQYVQMSLFDLIDKNTSPEIPLNLIANQQQPSLSRRV